MNAAANAPAPAPRPATLKNSRPFLPRQKVKRELVGVGGGLRRDAGMVGGEDVLVRNGGAVTDLGLAALVARRREPGAICTAAVSSRHAPRA